MILLSGGLDSAVTLFFAKDKGYDCYCIVSEYGQRHKREVRHAKLIAEKAGAKLHEVKLSFPWNGSSLTDAGIKLPSNRTLEEIKKEIPGTYVPARNTIFLSIAASLAETIGASSIFIGAHSEDSSGYPDCRIEYLEAFNNAVRLGTRAGIKGGLKIEFPLADKNKKEIIELGQKLGVPFEHTWSCYEGGASPCGICDSCILRAKGFKEAGVEDPALD